MTDDHQRRAEQLARVLEETSGSWQTIERPREMDAEAWALLLLATAVARAMRQPIPRDPSFKERLRASFRTSSGKH